MIRTMLRWLPRVALPLLTPWDPAPPDRRSDPLLGLAGLVLIPLAGVYLGYRQARVAQAAERVRRR